MTSSAEFCLAANCVSEQRTVANINFILIIDVTLRDDLRLNKRYTKIQVLPHEPASTLRDYFKEIVSVYCVSHPEYIQNALHPNIQKLLMLLGTSPCKPTIFRNRVRKAIVNEV
jgi:hypothetical protein